MHSQGHRLPHRRGGLHFYLSGQEGGFDDEEEEGFFDARVEVVGDGEEEGGVGGGVGFGVIGVGVIATVSSSTIVPVAADLVSVAFVGLLKATENVSFDSAVVSRVTSTVTSFCVSPGANVSVPVAAA